MAVVAVHSPRRFLSNLDDAAAGGVGFTTIETASTISTVANSHFTSAVGATRGRVGYLDAFVALVKVVDVGFFGIVCDGGLPCFNGFRNLFNLFVGEEDVFKGGDVVRKIRDVGDSVWDADFEFAGVVKDNDVVKEGLV